MRRGDGMIKKCIKIVVAFMLMLVFVASSSSTKAAGETILEVGEVRSLSETATVPVVLHNATYLTS